MCLRQFHALPSALAMTGLDSYLLLYVYVCLFLYVYVCLFVCRNLSSVNERTRQKMRDMRGLVDSLVSYIQQEERADDKVTGLKSSII